MNKIFSFCLLLFAVASCQTAENHVYSVTALNNNIIELRNPWGEQHVIITVDEFQNLYASITFQTMDIRFNFSSFEQKK